MQTGSLTPDNFSQVLRALAQRRKQGVLEIRVPENPIKILFNGGRIVDFIEAQRSPFVEVVEILQGGEILDAAPEVNVKSYKELFELLKPIAGSEFNAELFGRVLKHRVLNKLYALDLRSGAFFTFNGQMLEGDREHLPAVSAGGLLLDLVALEGDGARYEQTFPPASRIAQSGSTPPALSEEEQILYDAIGSGVDREALVRRSMLSRFAIQDTLLGMYDRGYISPVSSSSAAERPVAGKSELDDLVAALEGPLDAAIDRVFADEPTTEPNVPPSSAATTVAQPVLATAAPPQTAPPETPYLPPRPPPRAQLTMLSTRLLYAPWVLHILVFLWFCIALVAPFVIWPYAMFASF